MKRWKHAFWLLALGVTGLIGSFMVLYLSGGERLSQILAPGAMIISGPGIFLVGLVSLLGTRTFLSKAAAAKGRVSALYEVLPAGGCLLPGRIVTIQFWTEQEESIEFQSHTFQRNPETVAGSLPVLYDPEHPAEAKIHSFEGLWLTSGLVMVIGAGLSLIFMGLCVSVLS